jgi:hypothetical protein
MFPKLALIPVICAGFQFSNVNIGYIYFRALLLASSIIRMYKTGCRLAGAHLLVSGRATAPHADSIPKRLASRKRCKPT